METWAQYSCRKRREARVIRDAPLAPWPTASSELPVHAGEKIDLLRSHPAFRAAAAFPETNWTKTECITLGGYSFRYGYQRFDLQVTAPPVYPALGSPERTFYTCSGMAAVTAVVIALNRLAQSRIAFWSVTDAYFETQHLVRHYADRLDVRVAARFGDLAAEAGDAFIVVHIDSICARGPDELWDLLTDRVILAIFDTTCYSRGDNRIEDTVRRLESRGIPVVIVRSHLKLDSLGLEAGRLGSIHLRAPEGCGAVPRQVLEAIAHLVPDVVRLFGIAPSIDRFPIFADDDELLELSVLRAEMIKRNSAAIADELERAVPDIAVRRYHHGMFLTLHRSNWTAAEPVRKIASAIEALCRQVGSHVAHATSFGFDFTVVTDVMDVATDRFCLRLAPSDEPLDRMLSIVPMLVRALDSPARTRTAPD